MSEIVWVGEGESVTAKEIVGIIGEAASIFRLPVGVDTVFDLTDYEGHESLGETGEAELVLKLKNKLYE